MSRPASELDFDREVFHFSQHEFPAETLDNVSADLVFALDKLRDQFGDVIHPSPLAAGWYRKDGSSTSRHYAVGRLSDAGDVFPQGDVLRAWVVAQSIPEIGGIGLYFDTNGPNGEPWPMMHIDLRPQRLLWARHKPRVAKKSRYVYPANGGDQKRVFYELLCRHASAD